jgi:hypothetical protein
MGSLVTHDLHSVTALAETRTIIEVKLPQSIGRPTTLLVCRKLRLLHPAPDKIRVAARIIRPQKWSSLCGSGKLASIRARQICIVPLLCGVLRHESTVAWGARPVRLRL